MSRRSKRRERREQARQQKKLERCEGLGGLGGIFTFRKTYRQGKKCCNGVRWKDSTQNFERHLFSTTALCCYNAKQQKTVFHPYHHFMLMERGKWRPIDAPKIQDRQPEKVFTHDVLLPIYRPCMIYDNGASLPGFGLDFTIRRIKTALHRHYRKYGRNGYVLIMDAHQFFPNASHKHILERHERLILDNGLKWFADAVLKTVPGGVGMPLGVEPSQAEMIALPSKLDTYIQCQMGLGNYMHFMDDFLVIIPPGKNPVTVANVMKEMAPKCGFFFGDKKTVIKPFSRPFQYCKATYRITKRGKVVITGSGKTVSKAKRKLQAFRSKIEIGEMEWGDVWASANGSIGGMKRYSDHGKILSVWREFYKLFGFSCETYEKFKEGISGWNTSQPHGLSKKQSVEK